mmetsp:Transcript_42111/g.76168  ORF Transcript_42111/g.76168 Transcript_42111/m.76168 type:complete len:80 (+) Transcript_42111:209-448(+)
MIITSSSRRMGRDRTEYFRRSSLLSGALISFLRMWEGAVKCALRFLRLEQVTVAFCFILLGNRLRRQQNEVEWVRAQPA